MSKAQFMSTMLMLIIIIVSVAIFVFLFFFALNLPQGVTNEQDFEERCENICQSLNSRYVESEDSAVSYLRENGWCVNRKIPTGENETMSIDCARYMQGCMVHSLGREILSEEC